MTLSFDELRDLAQVSRDPIPLDLKSLGGRRVYIRHPSSGDVDRWRMWCNKHQGGDQPMAARLVQIMLCDEQGKHIVPQVEPALADLADLDPKVIDEIAKACLPLVQETTDEELEDEKKD